MKVSKKTIITELSKKLGEGIDEKTNEWMLQNLGQVGFEFRGDVICTECGNKFHSETMNIDGTITCPCCGKKLTIEHTTKKNYKKQQFMMVTHEFDGWQVFRYFYVEKEMRYNSYQDEFKVFGGCFEVMQKWLSQDGMVGHMSRRLRMFCSRMYNPFNLDSELHYRAEVTNYYYSYYDPTDISYSCMKILSLAKFMKQLGFDKTRSKNRHHGFWIDDLAQAIKSEPLYELLYKAKKYSIMRYLNKNRFLRAGDAKEIEKRRAALKIAIRHKYFDTKQFDVNENRLQGVVSDWCDTVGQIISLGLDYRNPHFVCTDSLYDDHRYYTKKLNKIADAERRKNEMQKAFKMEGSYIKARECYFPLEIKDDVLTIKVLPNVKSFAEEGEKLNHCVYGSEYFNMQRKPNSLILSARIGEDWANPDEYVETIEVNLVDYSVVQSRGQQNQPSKYHNRIMRLMYSNMDKIIACEKEGEKKKDKLNKEAA